MYLSKRRKNLSKRKKYYKKKKTTKKRRCRKYHTRKKKYIGRGYDDDENEFDKYRSPNESPIQEVENEPDIVPEFEQEGLPQSNNSRSSTPGNIVWNEVKSVKLTNPKEVNVITYKQQTKPSPKPYSIKIGNQVKFSVNDDNDSDNKLQIIIRDFLEKYCINSNYCMAFGIEKETLIDYFSFSTFKNVKFPIKLLSNGQNGIVYELIHEKLGYKGYSIMKINKFQDSDSLFLEAYNGMKYINKYNNYYPCFIETYGYYKMDPNVNNVEDIMNLEQLRAAFTQVSLDDPITDELIVGSCTDFNHGILLQYLEKPIELEKWIDNNIKSERFGIELSHILFQVYSVLSVLNNRYKFTHYDLHTSNVLLYELPNLTTFVYKVNVNLNITIYTKYIVKIIDYGRVYTKSNINIFNTICKYPVKCKNKPIIKPEDNELIVGACGNQVGYEFMQNPEIWKNNSVSRLLRYYINTLIPNRSHDLILANRIKNKRARIFRDQSKNIESQNMNKSLLDILTGIKYMTDHGTPEMVTINNDDVVDYILLQKLYNCNKLLDASEISNAKQNVENRLLGMNGDQLLIYEFLEIKTVQELYYALIALMTTSGWKNANEKYKNELSPGGIKNELYIDLMEESAMIYKTL